MCKCKSLVIANGQASVNNLNFTGKIADSSESVLNGLSINGTFPENMLPTTVTASFNSLQNISVDIGGTGISTGDKIFFTAVTTPPPPTPIMLTDSNNKVRAYLTTEYGIANVASGNPPNVTTITGSIAVRIQFHDVDSNGSATLNTGLNLFMLYEKDDGTTLTIIPDEFTTLTLNVKWNNLHCKHYETELINFPVTIVFSSNKDDVTLNSMTFNNSLPKVYVDNTFKSAIVPVTVSDSSNNILAKGFAVVDYFCEIDSHNYEAFLYLTNNALLAELEVPADLNACAEIDLAYRDIISSIKSALSNDGEKPVSEGSCFLAIELPKILFELLNCFRTACCNNKEFTDKIAKFLSKLSSDILNTSTLTLLNITRKISKLRTFCEECVNVCPTPPNPPPNPPAKTNLDKRLDELENKIYKLAKSAVSNKNTLDELYSKLNKFQTRAEMIKKK